MCPLPTCDITDGQIGFSEAGRKDSKQRCCSKLGTLFPSLRSSWTSGYHKQHSSRDADGAALCVGATGWLPPGLGNRRGGPGKALYATLASHLNRRKELLTGRSETYWEQIQQAGTKPHAGVGNRQEEGRPTSRASEEKWPSTETTSD